MSAVLNGSHGYIPWRRESTVERVSFLSGGRKLVGNLHLPAGATRGARLEAVVVAGAWRTVKEQMPTTYARAMAERGFAALTFDFRGWGESEGRPHRMEDPLMKAADIAAAALYLSERDDIVAERVAGIGLCASGGYLAAAATQTERICSVALVAPALPSRATVEAHLGGAAAVAALERVAAGARETYERTGEEQLVEAYRAADHAHPGEDYYTNRDRGAIPEWDNTFNPASWSQWLAFDAQAAADALDQPLLVVASEQAESPESVREFVARARIRRPVDELWLPNVRQFDFYDKPGPVEAVSDAAAEFFAYARRMI